MDAERREHPRHATDITIEIRDRRSGDRAIEVKGVTKNISRGGVLAVLDEEVTLGAASNCLVRFKDETGTLIAPEFRWGVALRSYRIPSGLYEVAIVFETPLEPGVVKTLWAGQAQ